LHWQYDNKGYQKVKGGHTINYSKSTPNSFDETALIYKQAHFGD
jgi:hypothetical protein